VNGKSFEASGHNELNVRDLKRLGTVVGGEREREIERERGGKRLREREGEINRERKKVR